MISDELIKLREIPNETLDEFYTVSMDNFQTLKLQGSLNCETIQAAKELGVELIWDNNSNALRGAGGVGITICLML
jgi:hypothetical protein